MWSALENLALRESLPKSLEPGDTIHDILVSGQLNRGQHNLHHLGQRRSSPYLLKQFFSLNTNAFLRWQNESRFAALPQTSVCTWPVEEWRGGTIAPFAEGGPLEIWLDQDEIPMDDRITTAHNLAAIIAYLHGAGIAHRNLTPSTIHIDNKGIVITDFGSAHFDLWDDFWADSLLPSCDSTCASPQLLQGIPHGFAEDTYAFGAILHLLLSGATPFNAIKRLLRPMLPGYIPPDALPDNPSIPLILRQLVTACLAPNHVDRPTMQEAAATLSSFSNAAVQPLPDIRSAVTNESLADRNRVMGFITDHSGSLGLFDEVLEMAKETPSIFLFVGLIPGNLPSGHAERYRGKLFKKMAQGLFRCRQANLTWSLRMMESFAPEKTGLELARQYRPDTALLVAPLKENTFFHSTDFLKSLAGLGIKTASVR